MLQMGSPPTVRGGKQLEDARQPVSFQAWPQGGKAATSIQAG
jgi:hypothetical protein